MAKRVRLFTIVAMAGLFLVPARASADPLLPGQIVRVDFDFLTSLPFPSNLGVPDLLRAEFNAQVMQPFGTFTANLFDGSALLGTYQTSVNGGSFVGGLTFNSVFVAPGTVYDMGVFGPPGTADFTSIRDRSIDGRFELSIASGRVDVDLSSLQAQLWKTLPNGTLTGNTFANPRISRVSIENPVPEPGSLILLATGGALAMRRRWTRPPHWLRSPVSVPRE